jgi:hypothetical protein
MKFRVSVYFRNKIENEKTKTVSPFQPKKKMNVIFIDRFLRAPSKEKNKTLSLHSFARTII